MKRAMYIGLGWFCLALGAVGVALPLLPTTPFVIVAAWAFARSSPRFQSWLEEHRLFGPYIQDWRRYGVIPLSAKLLAITMMSASLVWLVAFTEAPLVAKIAVAASMAGVAAFLLSRPSASPEPS
jgi:hypothetical protein